MSHGGLWMIGGMVLAAMEMVAPGAFLLWIGLAALGCGLVTEVFHLGVVFQVLLFIVLTVALVAPVGMRRRKVPDVVNSPAANLIGRNCRALAFHNGEGRVVLGDGTWSARVADHSNPASGTSLQIVALEGTILVVAPPPQATIGEREC